MSKIITNFTEAEKEVHRVEDEWHFPVLTLFNFQPIEKQTVGRIRVYHYKNETQNIIKAAFSYGAFYWKDKEKYAGGVDLRSLEEHLKIFYK